MSKKIKKLTTKTQLYNFRSTMELTEKLTEKLLFDSWANPDLGDEYFRDALVAMLHVTTRTLNKVQEIEKRLEREKGAG